MKPQLLFWALLLPLGLAGQPSLSPQTQDSLFAIWEDRSQEDSTRLQALYDYTWDYYLFSDPDSAVYWADIQHAFARESGQLAYAGQAYNIKAVAAMIKGEMETVADFFLKAIALFDSAGAQSAAAGALGNLGGYYYQVSEWDLALTYHQKSLAIFEELGYKQGIANEIGNLGLIYRELGRLGEANAHFFRALKIGEEIGDKRGIGSALSSLSLIYEHLKDYDRSLEFAKRSLKIAQELNNLRFQSNSLNIIGNQYSNQFKFDSAIYYYEASLRMAEKVESGTSISLALNNLGNVFCNKNMPEKAIPYLEKALAVALEHEDIGHEILARHNLGHAYLQLKRYPEAFSYSLQSLQMAQELNDIQNEKLAAYDLYAYYKETGQSSKALEMHELYLVKRDSLESEENQRQALRQEYQYEYDKQALTDSLTFVQQQASTELAYQKQLSQRNYLLFGGLALALMGFIFFRYRQQIRNRERELELQRERERKEQLDQLNQMKSRFFANISHEFRTPLTLVLGQNQQLQAELDDPRMDPKFDRVDRNGRRLLELVNQVLDLSKLEAGNMALKSETLDLIPFLKNILFSFESLADQKQQALVFEHDTDNLLIVADPEKLERVFFNLLANAIKFTPERGQITLRLKKTAQHVRIGVIDTGIGIPEAQLPLIFDRFFQAEGGDTHPSPGTGIGLALAKELVELHQGQIEVSSQPQKGTEFWVDLPPACGRSGRRRKLRAPTGAA
ncbi:MAG: tetratricopeptide repeat-containing sensor histidine kinase [Bacteroidota bacterium]